MAESAGQADLTTRAAVETACEERHELGDAEQSQDDAFRAVGRKNEHPGDGGGICEAIPMMNTGSAA
jgi:hypothetical protein